MPTVITRRNVQQVLTDWGYPAHAPLRDGLRTIGAILSVPLCDLSADLVRLRSKLSGAGCRDARLEYFGPLDDGRAGIRVILPIEDSAITLLRAAEDPFVEPGTPFDEALRSCDGEVIPPRYDARVPDYADPRKDPKPKGKTKAGR